MVLQVLCISFESDHPISSLSLQNQQGFAVAAKLPLQIFRWVKNDVIIIITL
jgi:hypothetical protein